MVALGIAAGAQRPSHFIGLYEEPFAAAFDKAVRLKLWLHEQEREDNRIKALRDTMVNLWTVPKDDGGAPVEEEWV